MHTLIIGNKNYSSWSLRAWLALKKANVEFKETLIRLDQPDFKAEILSHSPAGTVPILHLPDATTIAESLAICEYANEACGGKLYPQDQSARAVARAYAAEMHSGFTTLRSLCPMNIRKDFPRHDTAPAATDIRRIESMWTDALTAHDRPFLFGDFSVADAMFAPIVMRFIGYDVQPNEACQKYMQNITALPEMQAWITEAKKEAWVIPEDEIKL